MRSAKLIATIAVLCCAGVAIGDGTHPFSVHDLVTLRRISDPRVSPDGRSAVFVLRSTDLEANRGRTDLWLTGIDGDGLRQLTSHPANDWHPRWSSDGRKIWFLSKRSTQAEIWRIAVDGGEAACMTELALPAGSFNLSRDGHQLALSMKVFPGLSPEQTKQRLEAVQDTASSGLVFDRSFVRHWDTWRDGRRNHVFVMPAAGGDPLDVMMDVDADCPTQPFGCARDYTFSPDGQHLVFCARIAGAAEAWSTNFDLFVVPADCLWRAHDLSRNEIQPAQLSLGKSVTPNRRFGISDFSAATAAIVTRCLLALAHGREWQQRSKDTGEFIDLLSSICPRCLRWGKSVMTQILGVRETGRPTTRTQISPV